MLTDILLVNAIALLIYMTTWFVIAKKINRLDLVDAAWGSGFALVAWIGVFFTPEWPNILLALLVTIWSVRLTRHIAQRLRKKRDPRYELISSKWKGNFWVRAFFSVYLLQGVMVWVVTLPIALAAGPQDIPAATGLFAIIGATVWLAGFIFEAIGDKQLHDFIAVPTNKGKVMDRGLWRYSRHPNYFGELLLWYGIAIFAFPASYGIFALIGPFVLSVTIIFASGIPPIENRRKDDKAYQEYAKRTSVLIPLPPKK